MKLYQLSIDEECLKNDIRDFFIFQKETSGEDASLVFEAPASKEEYAQEQAFAKDYASKHGEKKKFATGDTATFNGRPFEKTATGWVNTKTNVKFAEDSPVVTYIEAGLTHAPKGSLLYNPAFDKEKPAEAPEGEKPGEKKGGEEKPGAAPEGEKKDGEKKDGEEKPTPAPGGLNADQVTAKLQALWDKWTSTGKNAGPEMRKQIKQMWLDAGGIKAEGKASKAKPILEMSKLQKLAGR